MRVPGVYIDDGGFMRANQVELSWDAGKNKWLIRIQAGGEVIRRHCDIAKSADDETLRSAAQETARDEGYETDPAQITIRH